MARSPIERRVTRATFAEACAIVSDSRRRGGEGYRHGWIGNTGSGKTSCLRAFLALDETFTLIHDDTKRAAQYPGAVVENFADAPDDARTVILRGDVFKGTVVEVEDVAGLALKITRSMREPCNLVVDELNRAMSEGGQRLKSPSLLEVLIQGRALDLSLLWSTQTPQRTSVEVIDQSSTIALCALGPKALNYMDERLKFDPELLDAVKDLRSADDGGICDFVLYQSGKRWNRTIYSYDVRSVASNQAPSDHAQIIRDATTP